MPRSKKLLLIDGIGALTSALFLGIILVRLQPHIGMPVNTLYVLAILAATFAFFSFGSYFILKQKWEANLRIIAIVNLCYCVITLVLVVINYQTLTGLGLGYFVLEMIIIIVLVRLELASTLTENNDG